MRGGGQSREYDIQEGGGGDRKADEYRQWEGGGQKSRKFCGCDMYTAPQHRGHSQMTSEERGREGVSQFLTIEREVAWIW